MLQCSSYFRLRTTHRFSSSMLYSINYFLKLSEISCIKLGLSTLRYLQKSVIYNNTYYWIQYIEGHILATKQRQEQISAEKAKEEVKEEANSSDEDPEVPSAPPSAPGGARGADHQFPRICGEILRKLSRVRYNQDFKISHSNKVSSIFQILNYCW